MGILGLVLLVVVCIGVGILFARRNKKETELLHKVVKEAEDKAKELFKK